MYQLIKYCIPFKIGTNTLLFNTFVRSNVKRSFSSGPKKVAAVIKDMGAYLNSKHKSYNDSITNMDPSGNSGRKSVSGTVKGSGEKFVKDSKKGQITSNNHSAIRVYFRAIAQTQLVYWSDPANTENSGVLRLNLGINYMLQCDIIKLVQDTIDAHNKYIVTTGIKTGTKSWKAICHHIIILLEGGNPTPNFAVGKDLNFPTVLNHLRPLYKVCTLFNKEDGYFPEQMLRSILGVNRMVEDFSEVDTSTITPKCEVDNLEIDKLHAFVEDLFKNKLSVKQKAIITQIKTFKVEIPKNLTKNGPNKTNKVNSAMAEAYALWMDKDGLGKEFFGLCLLIGQEQFADYVILQGQQYKKYLDEANRIRMNLKKPQAKKPLKTEALTIERDRKPIIRYFMNRGHSRAIAESIVIRSEGNGNPKIKSNQDIPNKSEEQVLRDRLRHLENLAGNCKILTLEEIQLRTLTSVTDTGNKSRTIAISDFWTQALLAGMEKGLETLGLRVFKKSFDLLDHQDGFRKAYDKLKPGWRSIDYSAWTDRFSAKFQVEVLSIIYGREFSNHWNKLVVVCPWSIEGSKAPIHYGTGQGMGTKGSFIIACLTDMLLTLMVFTENDNTGIFKKNPLKALALFQSVGDDCVKFDPLGVIMEAFRTRFKVPINVSKSKIATEANFCMEYVSFNVNYGNNVSRVSLRLINLSRKDSYSYPILVHHTNQRASMDWGIYFKMIVDEGITPQKQILMLFDIANLMLTAAISTSNIYLQIRDGIQCGIVSHISKCDSKNINLEFNSISMLPNYGLLIFHISLIYLGKLYAKHQELVLKTFMIDPGFLEIIGLESFDQLCWFDNVGLRQLLAAGDLVSSLKYVLDGSYNIDMSKFYSLPTLDEAMATVWIEILSITKASEALKFTGSLYYNGPESKLRQAVPVMAKLRSSIKLRVVNKELYAHCEEILPQFDRSLAAEWFLEQEEGINDFFPGSKMLEGDINYLGLKIGPTNFEPSDESVEDNSTLIKSSEEEPESPTVSDLVNLIDQTGTQK
jgi:hypothetical protein